MLRRVGRVGSLGHYGFKASFIDGLCGVCGLALTVDNVLRESASSTSLGRLAGALMPLSAMSVSLCFVTVCHCETTPTLSAGSEAAENKVHKVPILIKREKVVFLTAGYHGTFLVSVNHATLGGSVSGGGVR